jgi:outer membrane biosynthesis protein TonB
MWETPAGQPAALRAWFYPGDNFGQEFAYSKEKWAQMAIVTKEEVQTLTTADETNIVAVDKTITETKTEVAAAPEPAPTPAPAPVETAQVTPPAPPVQPEPTPEPVRTVAAEPQPAPLAAVPADDNAALPQTASNWFEVTMLGALLGFVGLFLIRNNVSA